MSRRPSSFQADAGIYELIYKQLMEENTRLRTVLYANQCDIEITGPCGFPTYASCDLKDTMNDCFTMSHKLAFGHQLMSYEVHVRRVGRVVTFSEMIESKAWIAKDIHKGGFCLETHAETSTTSPLSFLQVSFGDDCDDDQLAALRKLLIEPSLANQMVFSKEWIYGEGYMIPVTFHEFEASNSIFDKVIEEKTSVSMSWTSAPRSRFITSSDSDARVV